LYPFVANAAFLLFEAPMRRFALPVILALFGLSGCTESDAYRDDRPAKRIDVDVDDGGAKVDIERRPRRNPDRDVDVDVNRNGVDVDVERGGKKDVDIDIGGGRGVDVDVNPK
jgi:hypothetical protein